MALRDRLKGAFSGKKSKNQPAGGEGDANGESLVKHYALDRNQCWAILMARVDSIPELTEHEWFQPAIQSLNEIELLQTHTRDDGPTWQLTGMGKLRRIFVQGRHSTDSQRRPIFPLIFIPACRLTPGQLVGQPGRGSGAAPRALAYADAVARVFDEI